MELDRSKLSIDRVAQLDQYNASQKQISLLKDMASVMEEAVVALHENKDQGEKAVEQFGPLLVDIREQLSSLNGKEAPEIPDSAKPVVEALSNLEKTLAASFKGIDLKPNISVQAPDVNVPAVTVDTKEMAKILQGMPQAFRDAIALIPQPQPEDNSDLVDRLDAVLAKLGEIDVGVRLKPQAPNTLKVTNPDGSLVSSAAYGIQIDVASSTVTYIGKAAPGTATSASTWQLKKIDSTSGTSIVWASGNSNFDKVWDNRASLSYS